MRLIYSIYTGIILFATVFCFSQIPTVGLIGGWPFTGNANDMSGSGNHGTVYGASLTTDRFGALNSAYHFNGSSNYIDMLYAGPTGSVSRSISFWARTTYTSAVTVGYSYGTAGGGGIFQVNFNYGCQGAGFDNSNAAAIHGNSIVNNNQWHHIVAILNSSVGIMVGSVQIYIDGVLQPGIVCAQGGTTSTVNSNSFAPVRVGRDLGTRFFNGDLDDFYMYNKVLTSTEINDLFTYSPCSGSPLTPASISGSTSVCFGANIVYSVAPVSGATSYTWSIPGGWTGTSTTNIISVVAGTSGPISVSAKNTCGTSQPMVLNVTVNPNPVVSIASSQLNICKGSSVTLNGNGADNYLWNMSIPTQSIVVSPTITTTYTLTGTTMAGCTGTATSTVSVTGELPTISVLGPSVACPGQTVNIASNGANTYTWQPGNMNGFLVTVSPTVTTNYTVTGTDNNGCVNSTVYKHKVTQCTGINSSQGSETILNVFPNPFNEDITIITDNMITSTVEVYNSTGALVYSSHYNGVIKIHLSGKEAGIYFVMVINEQGSYRKKVIKF